jgi:hypothetical protein
MLDAENWTIASKPIAATIDHARVAEWRIDELIALDVFPNCLFESIDLCERFVADLRSDGSRVVQRCKRGAGAIPPVRLGSRQGPMRLSGSRIPHVKPHGPDGVVDHIRHRFRDILQGVCKAHTSLPFPRFVVIAA